MRGMDEPSPYCECAQRAAMTGRPETCPACAARERPMFAQGGVISAPGHFAPDGDRIPACLDTGYMLTDAQLEILRLTPGHIEQVVRANDWSPPPSRRERWGLRLVLALVVLAAASIVVAAGWHG